MTADLRRDFTLFLLQTMTGPRALQAQAALGASDEEKTGARQRVESAGLMDLVRSLERFEQALGPPDDLSELADGGRRLCYRVDLWPSFWFAIEGDSRSIVSNLCFVRRPGTPEPRLEPWGLLLDEVDDIAPVRAVVDEWFPHKALLVRRESESLVLCFDYELLQDTKELTEQEAAALEQGAAPSRG